MNLSVLLAILPNRFRGLENLLGPSTNPEIFRKVCPADYAGRIQQKFARPGDVLTPFSCSRMNQIIAANRLCFGIRKKSKRVAGFLTKVTRDFWQVYTNSHRTNTRLMELIQTLLNAPQLGVA
jgi:hypothetical protein